MEKKSKMHGLMKIVGNTALAWREGIHQDMLNENVKKKEKNSYPKAGINTGIVKYIKNMN